MVENAEGSQTFLSSASKGAIQTGQSVNLESAPAEWKPTAGTHRVWARVSAGKTVSEANDWNNTGTPGSSTVIVVP